MQSECKSCWDNFCLPDYIHALPSHRSAALHRYAVADKFESALRGWQLLLYERLTSLPRATAQESSDYSDLPAPTVDSLIAIDVPLPDEAVLQVGTPRVVAPGALLAEPDMVLLVELVGTLAELVDATPGRDQYALCLVMSGYACAAAANAASPYPFVPLHAAGQT